MNAAGRLYIRDDRAMVLPTRFVELVWRETQAIRKRDNDAPRDAGRLCLTERS